MNQISYSVISKSSAIPNCGMSKRSQPIYSAESHVINLYAIYFADFLRRECKFFIQTSPLHLTASLMRLYTCLMDEISAQATAEGSDRMSATQV